MIAPHAASATVVFSTHTAYFRPKILCDIWRHYSVLTRRSSRCSFSSRRGSWGSCFSSARTTGFIPHPHAARLRAPGPFGGRAFLFQDSPPSLLALPFAFPPESAAQPFGRLFDRPRSACRHGIRWRHRLTLEPDSTRREVRGRGRGRQTQGRRSHRGGAGERGLPRGGTA